MVLPIKVEVVIKVLLQENGYAAKRFIKKFLNKNWSLNKLLAKIDQTTLDCKPGSCKKCKTWIAQDVDSVEGSVLIKRMHRILTKPEFPKHQCTGS